MKSLSELVDAWRSESLELLPSKSEESITIDLCADQLEAWLREAEIWVANNRYQAVVLLGENEVSNLGGQLITEDVLSKLLGTTRTEGKK